jgi:cytochrome c oxidase subunit 2
VTRLRAATSASLLAVLLLACGEEVRDSITDPASPQAAEIDWLWSLSLWLGTAVWVVVMVLLAVPMLRSRRRAREDADVGPRDAADAPPATPVPAGSGGRPPPAGALDEPLVTADATLAAESSVDGQVRSRLLWIGGIIGPTLILVLLLVASGRVGAATAHVEREGELVIDVVGYMFWWEVIYPEEEIVTANELVVPVDRPVRLRLTTDDVIHSFWIPRVHGKIDMIPGHENDLSFVPDQTGRFRGQCAEFCGIAHAQMVQFLDVVEPDEYEAWVANQQQDAPPPTDPQTVAGQRVFIESGCAACHAVQGTAAVAQVGPDLTHLMSRGSLAAGIVPNTRDNLERLIVDPWGIKPGNPMPPTVLDDDDLEALLDYLEILE